MEQQREIPKDRQDGRANDTARNNETAHRATKAKNTVEWVKKKADPHSQMTTGTAARLTFCKLPSVLATCGNGTIETQA